MVEAAQALVTPVVEKGPVAELRIANGYIPNINNNRHTMLLLERLQNKAGRGNVGLEGDGKPISVKMELQAQTTLLAKIFVADDAKDREAAIAAVRAVEKTYEMGPGHRPL